MKLNEGTRVSTDLRTIAGIIAAVAIAVFAYTELTARLVSLETSRELFQADLLKKSEQLPCLLYTSPSPRDRTRSRMPSSA